MIYREQGYLSEPARELIKIVRSFNWDGEGRASQEGPETLDSRGPTSQVALRSRLKLQARTLETFVGS